MELTQIKLSKLGYVIQEQILMLISGIGMAISFIK
jgi:hypothetical protein